MIHSRPNTTLSSDLPTSKLEAELILTALGDCTDRTVLDLGGGSGIHARKAVSSGSSVVDVVDISPEMMRIGQDAESNLGREDRIRWFQADATQPIAEQIQEGVCARRDMISLWQTGCSIMPRAWMIFEACGEM